MPVPRSTARCGNVHVRDAAYFFAVLFGLEKPGGVTRQPIPARTNRNEARSHCADKKSAPRSAAEASKGSLFFRKVGVLAVSFCPLSGDVESRDRPDPEFVAFQVLYGYAFFHFPFWHFHFRSFRSAGSCGNGF